MKKLQVVEVRTREQIEALGSALTIEGLARSGFSTYLDWIEAQTTLEVRRVYRIRGQVMNDIYDLTGSNRYPDDLNIVSVDLNDLADWKKLIHTRLTVGARWLDDIIDNNLAREAEKRGEER